MPEIQLTFDWWSNQQMIDTAQLMQKHFWLKENGKINNYTSVIFPTWFYWHWDGIKLNEYTVNELNYLKTIVWNHWYMHKHPDGNKLQSPLTDKELLTSLLKTERLWWWRNNILRIYRPPYWELNWIKIEPDDRWNTLKWWTIYWEKFLIATWEIDSLDSKAWHKVGYKKLLNKIENKIKQKRWEDVKILLHNKSDFRLSSDFELFLSWLDSLEKKYGYDVSTKNLMTKYQKEINNILWETIPHPLWNGSYIYNENQPTTLKSAKNYKNPYYLEKEEEVDIIKPVKQQYSSQWDFDTDKEILPRTAYHNIVVNWTTYINCKFTEIKYKWNSKITGNFSQKSIFKKYNIMSSDWNLMNEKGDIHTLYKLKYSLWKFSLVNK